MVVTKNTNREHWLQLATMELRNVFEAAGFPLPEKVHLSVGFPSRGALSRSKRVIGQCWSHEVSADDVHHIFISPLLSDPVEVLATLVHELIHATVGTKHKHKGKFITAMKALGLAGKPTATVAGPELQKQLEDVLETIGAYPHAALDPKELAKEKKQSTRMLKATCARTPEPCSVNKKPYTVRLTRMHIDAFGAPVCPNCKVQMSVPGVAPEGEEEPAA